VASKAVQIIETGQRHISFPGTIRYKTDECTATVRPLNGSSSEIVPEGT